MNPCGAMTVTLPDATSASFVTAFYTAIMVGVGMGIDHGGDRSPRSMLAVEVQSSSGGFDRKQPIDHDEPGVAFDQRHVRHIEPAGLIKTFDNLEQAVLTIEAPAAGSD
jgi:hypothetical protein